PDVGRAQGALPVARVIFDPSTVREARDGQRGVKAQVQPNSGSARGPSGRGTSQWNTPWSLLRLPDPGRPSGHGEVARRNTTLGHRPGTSTPPTSRSAGRRPAWPEIEDLQGTSRPWDSSFWSRERLQGYLAIFTVTNVVGELVGEPNLRSVEAFLRFVERYLG
ncbi:MAG: hypothetical protein RXS23_10600, partial [Metallosphaera yellowstonensis]